MKKIEITVSPKGESRIETSGFTGSECRQASQFIEQAIGRTTKEKLKPEFHETASNANSLQT